MTADETPIFGYVAHLTQNGWGPRLEHACVAGLSQEHGIVKAVDSSLGQFKVGDLVAVLPVHSCLTANLMGKYLTLTGDIYHCMKE